MMKFIHEQRGELIQLSAVTDTVTVQESTIHGRGLFADRDLEAGTVFLGMDPDAFRQKRFHPWNQRNADLLSFFVNHSCDANATLTFSVEHRAMVIQALRSLKKGEEVTLNYWLIEIGGRRIPCLCGSANCRGEFPINRLHAV